MPDPTEKPVVDEFDSAFGAEDPTQIEAAEGSADTDSGDAAASGDDTDRDTPVSDDADGAGGQGEEAAGAGGDEGEDHTAWAGNDDGEADDEDDDGGEADDPPKDPPKEDEPAPVDPRAFLLEELGPAFVRDPEKRTVENVVHNVKSWNGRLSALRSENDRLKKELEEARAAKPAQPEPAQPESAPAAPGGPASQGPTDEDRRTAREQLAQEHGGTLPEWVDDDDIETRARQIEQWRTTSKRTVEEALDERLAPITKHFEQDEAEKARQVREQHFATIAESHEDYEERVSSDDFDLWLSQLPSIERPAYERVVNEGTAGEVIEMLDRYKRERGIATPDDSQETPPPKDPPKREAPRREPSAPAAGPGRNAAGKGGFEDGWSLPDARA